MPRPVEINPVVDVSFEFTPVLATPRSRFGCLNGLRPLLSCYYSAISSKSTDRSGHKATFWNQSYSVDTGMQEAVAYSLRRTGLVPGLLT